MPSIPKFAERALGTALQNAMADYQKVAAEIIRKLNEQVELTNAVIASQNQMMKAIGTIYDAQLALMEYLADDEHQVPKIIPKPRIDMSTEGEDFERI